MTPVLVLSFALAASAGSSAMPSNPCWEDIVAHYYALHEIALGDYTESAVVSHRAAISSATRECKRIGVLHGPILDSPWPATRQQDFTLLDFAAVADDEQLISELWSVGNRASQSNMTPWSDNSAASSLQLAAFFGAAKAAATLLRLGVPPDARDERGTTALMIVSTRWPSGAQIAALLVSAGADANAKTANGRTVLFFAVQHDDRRMVELLLRAGADPCTRFADGELALDVAVRLRHEKSAAALRLPSQRCSTRGKESQG